jgi:hypothetical protein
MQRILMLLVALLLTAPVFAHVPHFPTGDEPIEVPEPEVSKAYYLQGTPGVTVTFIVAPSERRLPVQVLVLDDDAGRAAQFTAVVDCGTPEELRVMDLPYYEPFSRIAHRIVATGPLGPSVEPCRLTVTQIAGSGVPITVSIGDIERFTAADMLGMLTLGRSLDRWRAGR